MSLNFTIEVIFDLIVSIFTLISSIYIYFLKDIRKIKSLVWISVNLIITSASYLCQAIAILDLNYFFHAIHSIGIFFNILIFIVGFNYITKESYLSPSVLFVVCIGILYLFFSFQWQYYEIIPDYGFPVIAITGLLLLTWNLLMVMITLNVIIWGLKIRKYIPLTMKRDAQIFVIGVALYSSVMGILFLLSVLLDPAIIYLTDDIFGAAIIGLCCFIIIQPKLLYTLPFTIYRIIVKDKDGNPLFEHDWSIFEEKEMKIFAGFLNAMKLMSEKVLKIGDPVEIKLEKGILIIQDSKLITVGLVASRSSRFLRETLTKFTNKFEEKFIKLLVEKIDDTNQYISAYELIQLFFSNFAYKLLINRKSPLMLANKIENELEKNLRMYLDNDFELMKAEILKVPLDIVKDYISLQEELSQETLINDTNKQFLIENKKKS